MNDNEKNRIAAAINMLRPDWPARSIRTLLDGPKLTNRPRRDVAIALTWVACDSTSKTPARVNETGPWWNATATDDRTTPRPPKKHEDCPVHPGNYADTCHGCASDKLAGEHTAPPELRRPDISNHLARTRAELASIKANLCGHGIDRARGICGPCDLIERVAKESTA